MFSSVEVSESVQEPRPPVSAVMAAFKSRFIDAAIESAMSQTYPLDRLVVVVDGPTDTYARAEAIAEQHETVTVVYQERQGIAEARNHALELGLGELAVGREPKYLTFLDDDDVWDQEFLNRLVGILESSDDKTVASYCGMYIIDELGQKIGSSAEMLGSDIDQHYGSTDFNKYLAQDTVPDSITSMLFRADLFRGPSALRLDLRLRLMSDIVLILEPLRQGGIMRGTSEPLLHYRRHPGQVTHDRSEAWRELTAIWQHYVPLMDNPDDRAKAYRLMTHWATVHGQDEVAEYMQGIADLLQESPAAPIPSYAHQTPQLWQPE